MNRRSWMKRAAAVAAFSQVSGCGNGKPSAAPNVLVVIVGNHRWDALSCADNTIIETPNLDGLANSGIRFENACSVAPVSLPGRTSIVTGQYAGRHGVIGATAAPSATGPIDTYTAYLHNAGYMTGFTGVLPAIPEKSCDVYHAFEDGDYFPEGRDGTHLTDLVTDHAVDFIQSTVSTEPWCLTVSYKASAPPCVPDSRYSERYEDTEILLPETANTFYHEMLPAILRQSYAYRGPEGDGCFVDRYASQELYQDSLEQYYRCITGVDDAVGRLCEAVRNQGVEDNTVIVYVSDSGELQGEHYLGGNVLLYEESVRIPLIIHVPGMKTGSERKSDALTASIDIAPTVLDLASVPIPSDMQGRSLTPLFDGLPEDRRTEVLLESYQNTRPEKPYPICQAIRTERWKYIRYAVDETVIDELYDIANDPKETVDVSASLEHRGTKIYLKRRLDELLADSQ